jgi:ATP-binding cassette subfamily F protein 3
MRAASHVNGRRRFYFTHLAFLNAQDTGIMSILTAHNVGQIFGGFTVFTGVNVSIARGAKIGMVGPNGIGKTTLLRVLAGLEEPAAGSASRASGIRIGYLRQEAMQGFSEQDSTLYEAMREVFADVERQEAKLRALEQHMAVDASDAIMDEYGRLLERFEQMGGYDYELRIEQTLSGLGFDKGHYDLPLKHLSGGQKTRALLAHLLLEKPDLLILDEPTNHLDVGAVEWLETTLHNWEGALLVVSHDRYFLDAVVNTIWEMSRGGITTYRGNYSAYLRQREANRERLTALYEQERERLDKELDFIKRNIARASTNGQAVGRLRRLSGALVAIETYGLERYLQMKWSEMGLNARPLSVMEAEQKLRAVVPPSYRAPPLKLRLRENQRSGDVVLRARDLEIGYPGNPLFITEDFTLRRGECVALIGDNGTGKTTFLKTLMRQIEPLAGNIQFGLNLRAGYFAQAHDDLNLDSLVIDELLRHRHMLISEARSYLAQYLFRGEDVYKRVGDLSGGERGRLALAVLALQGANFLLLDEPTNHLDIAAQEVLQEVLENFDGTILLVTHDRYLVDRLATQIWNLEAGYLNVFRGSYAEFVA